MGGSSCIILGNHFSNHSLAAACMSRPGRTIGYRLRGNGANHTAAIVAPASSAPTSKLRFVLMLSICVYMQYMVFSCHDPALALDLSAIDFVLTVSDSF